MSETESDYSEPNYCTDCARIITDADGTTHICLEKTNRIAAEDYLSRHCEYCDKEKIFTKTGRERAHMCAAMRRACRARRELIAAHCDMIVATHIENVEEEDEEEKANKKAIRDVLKNKTDADLSRESLIDLICWLHTKTPLV